MQVAEILACAGCPLRGDGSQQFYPDQLKHGAQVEVTFDTPIDSQSGLANLERTYYSLAGLEPQRVNISHAIRCGVSMGEISSAGLGGKKAHVLGATINYCRRAHSRSGRRALLELPPRLVVTLGNLALYAATGQFSAHEWRGWLLPYQSKSDSWLSEVWTPAMNEQAVLAMVRLGDVRAMPTLQYAMRADWTKVGKVLRKEWPKPWPGYDSTPPTVWPKLSAFDTEFDEHGTLERYSLYNGRGRPWVIEASDVRQLTAPNEAVVVMHNMEADIAHLQGFLQGGQVRVEDTMLMHSVLWSDLPHSLDYLGSIFAHINRWKHLFRRNPKVYSGGDSIGTWGVYAELVSQMQSDPQSAWVYRNAVFPLSPIIMEAETIGHLVHQERVQTALVYHDTLRQEITTETGAYCGWPMNLGSPEQVQRWLYEVEQVGRKRRLTVPKEVRCPASVSANC